MARILAIDYGFKRTGLAVTDPLQIIPGGLTTVATHTLWNFLEEYLKKEEVSCIVVGHPRQMDYTDSQTMTQIAPLVKKLRKSYPNIEVVLQDERFTSVLAQKTIRDAGLPKQKRQQKSLVDEVSAVIILQSYMDSCSFRENSI